MKTDFSPLPLESPAFKELEQKFKACRKDFPMLQQKIEGQNFIYFDTAATSLKPQKVIDACTHYYTHLGLNAHRGDFSINHRLEQEMQSCRELAKNFLGAKHSEEIIFTSGATASLNAMAYGFQDYLKSGDIVLTTHLEHASALLPWFDLAKKKGIIIKYLPLEKGLVELETFKKQIEPNVKVVLMTHMSNTLGYENPIFEIGNFLKDKNILFLVDAAQSAAHLPLNVENACIDALAISCHKILGPTGLGLLYLHQKHHSTFKPLFLGGGSNARFSEDGSYQLKYAPTKFESGTQHLAGILAFKEALLYLQACDLKAIHSYEQSLMHYLKTELQKIEHIEVYNLEAPSSTVLFNCKGIFAQDAAHYFASKGIAIRSGHHCAKLSHHVLQQDETLRITLSFYNTLEELNQFLYHIKQITLEACIALYLE